MKISNKAHLRILWGIRILLALAFGAAGTAKILGAPAMIEIFEHIGFGQWFRYVTGFVEVIGVVLLLVPSTSLVGALLLSATMCGAVLTHLTIIGGNPVPAIVLGTLSAYVAFRLWPNRGSSVLGRFSLAAKPV